MCSSSSIILVSVSLGTGLAPSLAPLVLVGTSGVACLAHILACLILVPAQAAEGAPIDGVCWGRRLEIGSCVSTNKNG